MGEIRFGRDRLRKLRISDPGLAAMELAEKATNAVNYGKESCGEWFHFFPF